MAARITRAKKKIAAGPHPVPGAGAATSCPNASRPCWPWCTCCSPPGTPRRPGADLVRRDLVERALDLARMLRELMPDDARGRRAAGAAAAHRRAPRDPDRPRTGGWCCSRSRTAPGGTAPRSPRGSTLVARRCGGGRPGRLRPAGRDRRGARRGAELGGDRLGARSSRSTTCCWVWPSPVVALNRAVAVGFARRPGGGAGRARRRWPPSRARRVRLPAGGARGLPAPARAGGRGAAGVRGGDRC